jgi:hypothetical protein
MCMAGEQETVWKRFGLLGSVIAGMALVVGTARYRVPTSVDYLVGLPEKSKITPGEVHTVGRGQVSEHRGGIGKRAVDRNHGVDADPCRGQFLTV